MALEDLRRSYVIVPTAIGGRALMRRIQDPKWKNEQPDDLPVAFQIGELGFFPQEKLQEETRAEIGRFFARCAECREPVAIPYSAVGEMAMWTGDSENGVPDWRHWLTNRMTFWGRYFPNHPMTARQRVALLQLEDLLQGNVPGRHRLEWTVEGDDHIAHAGIYAIEVMRLSSVAGPRQFRWVITEVIGNLPSRRGPGFRRTGITRREGFARSLDEAKQGAEDGFAAFLSRG